jgi:hypothetical protein
MRIREALGDVGDKIAGDCIACTWDEKEVTVPQQVLMHIPR